MTARSSATLRRRRLGGELRRLREDAELTIQEVAKRLECSESKISRIETGHVSATPRDVRDMLGLYRVNEEQRDALIQLAREVRQRGWWTSYADVPDGVPAYASLEVAAGLIHTYMALVVPALLQTEEYAHAVNSPSSDTLNRLNPISCFSTASWVSCTSKPLNNSSDTAECLTSYAQRLSRPTTRLPSFAD